MIRFNYGKSEIIIHNSRCKRLGQNTLAEVLLKGKNQLLHDLLNEVAAKKGATPA